MNVCTGAVDFSVPQGSFRFVKEPNDNLLFH
jgi:hypothetical protein